MKKHQSIIILLAVIAISVCALSACTQKRLQTPTDVKIENDCLVWSEVAGAQGYMVSVNDQKYFTDEPILDLLNITIEYTTYKFSVIALDSDAATDSIPSRLFVYKPKMPENIFDYTVINDKARTASIYLKSNIDESQIPEKLIIPALASNGYSIIKVGSLANKVTKSVWLPNSIEEISEYAFRNSSELMRINMPQRLKTIGYNAFENCAKLSEITIPDTVTTLFANAFNNCSSIKEINIPLSVTTIRVDQTGFFNGCDSLETITLTGSGSNAMGLTVENGCLMLSNRTLLRAVGNFTMPDNTATVYQFAVSGNKYVKNLTLPDSVTKVNSGAFSDCKNLETLSFGNGVVTLDSSTYPILYGCKNLKSVSIPAATTTIKSNLFGSCPALTNVTIDPANETYKSNGTFIVANADNSVVCGANATNLPTDSKRILDYAFAYSDIEEAVIPSGYAINSYAFANCRNLKKVTLPQDLASIKEGAFYNCYNLENIAIPDTVREISDFAFYGCYKLAANVPGTVTIMGNCAFYGVTVYTTANAQTSWVKDSVDKTSLIIVPLNNVSMFGNATFRKDGVTSYVYSVVYNKGESYIEFRNKADGVPDATTYRAVPVRNGYKFLGWSRTENSTAPDYAPTVYTPESELITPFEVCLTSAELKALAPDTVLYAVWQRI